MSGIRDPENQKLYDLGWYDGLHGLPLRSEGSLRRHDFYERGHVAGRRERELRRGQAAMRLAEVGRDIREFGLNQMNQGRLAVALDEFDSLPPVEEIGAQASLL